MSVLINGLKMPKNCYDCRLLYDCYSCKVTGTRIDYDRCDKERLADCPLIELPDHGDLVDRDELIEEAKRLGTVTCHKPFDFPYDCNLVEWCKAAETVIPAERSEE